MVNERPPPTNRGSASEPNTTRLLANRPFVLYAAHYGISSLGFWGFFLAILAQATYRYHAGSVQIAILLAVWSLVFLTLVAPAGMVTDRWSPKWMVLLAQVLAVASAVTALLGNSMWTLYAASVVDAVGAAMAIPGRGSLTALLVPKEDLVRANGAVNTVAMVAVIIGPGAAGLIARHGSQAAVYWVIIGILVLGVIPLLPVPDRRPQGHERTSPIREVAEGFRVAWSEPELRSLLFLACAAWVTLTVFVALEPLFVKQVLGRGEDGLGLFWSTNGVGSFLGALALTRSRKAAGREVLLIGVALILSGVGFLAFTGTSLLSVAIAGNVVMGVGFAWFLSLSQALIQRVAAEDLRGRVTSVMGMLQESSSVACSVAIAILGGLVLVRPSLVVAAVALIAGGLYGLRADRRIRRRVERPLTRRPEPLLAAMPVPPTGPLAPPVRDSDLDG
jgi:MFS family permease